MSPSTPRSVSPSPGRSPSPAHDSESDLDDDEFETIMLSLNTIAEDLRRYESELDVNGLRTPRGSTPRKRPPQINTRPPQSAASKPRDAKRPSIHSLSGSGEL